MIEDNKKCSICKYEYNEEIPHYCVKCGKNLTNQIEKSDVIFFFSKLFKVMGILINSNHKLKLY